MVVRTTTKCLSLETRLMWMIDICCRKNDGVLDTWSRSTGDGCSSIASPTCQGTRLERMPGLAQNIPSFGEFPVKTAVGVDE